jgi:polysaccharide deacetylase family protein (PEP-CTERM system associated)
MLHALTIDVEDYFQVHALSEVIDPAQWDSFESHVERNSHRILDLLDTCHGPRTTGDGHDSRPPRATFFILGWIAERHPALVKEIQSRGHEVACHGYAHQCIFNQTRDQFREDVRRAKGAIEDITGVEVVGYRAPTYSIIRKNLWALETLFQVGFRYDSSIFPIRHDYYGFPEAPRFPFYLDFTNGDLLSQFKNPTYLDFSRLKPQPSKVSSVLSESGALAGRLDERSDRTSAAIERAQRSNKRSDSHLQRAEGPSSHAPCPMRDRFVEFPMSTITIFGVKIPFSGGGYCRLFPYQYSRWAFRRMSQDNGQPAIFYLHPWELDPGMPKIDGASRLSKFRTYSNLSRTETKFKRLLSDFFFAPLGSLLYSAFDVAS